MVNFLVFVIILAPVGFWIFKKCARMWREESLKRLHNNVDEKLQEIGVVQDTFNKVKRIDVEDIKNKKQKINDVENL